jgi:hypothetical protein
MRQRGREVAEVVLHKPTDIMKAVNIIVQVRDVISDMFNRRIQLFQLMFIHFDNSYPRGEVRGGEDEGRISPSMAALTDWKSRYVLVENDGVC